MLDYFWIAILFPLFGAAVNGLIGKRLPQRLVGLVACGAIAASFIWSALSFRELVQFPAGPDRLVSRALFTWIQSGELEVSCSFLFDPLSSVMILIVTGVGFLIHVYSTVYMAGEGGYYRYFSYLNLFIFMMSVLVLADNYILMFVGWEGVGLCSYLLIGYYFERKSAGDAAKKAFIVNRIGDVGFILAAFLLFRTFGSFEYLAVFEQVDSQFPAAEASFGVLSVITVLLFVGATGKSAQIPLYVWLPDAMEGPTPVSALIHAATMVTAGVYMIARSAALYSRTPDTLLIVAVVGTATALLAACIALVQSDIKRVLAYSTVSQLGYMFLAVGVGAFGSGIFHLTTHAFFKALLFLGSGSVILALHHEQNLFRMGGLKKYLPVTFYTMWIATLAIAGFPFLSGFFSKDEILWNAFSLPNGHPILWAIGLLVAGLTAFYMFRLMFLAFHGERTVTPEHGHGHADPALSHGAPHEVREPSAGITLPLVILAVLSLVGGLIGLPAYLGSNVLETYLEPSFEYRLDTHGVEHGSHALEIALTIVTSLVALGGMAFAYVAYIKNRQLPARLATRLYGLYRAAEGKFYVDEVYDAVIVNPIERLSTLVLWRRVDAGLIDGMVNGTGGLVQYWGSSLRRLQTGYTRNYAAWILVGAILIFLYYYMGAA